MIAYFRKRKQKQQLKEIEFDIWMLTKGKWRASGYIRRVFYFLREHMELCEQEDWQRLYDECIYFQIIDARINNTWSEKHPEDQRGWVEFLADLAIKHDDDKSGRFSKEEVERYLNYRKTEWEHLKEPLCY